MDQEFRILDEDPRFNILLRKIEHVVGASEVEEPGARQSITRTKHDTGESGAVWQLLASS